MRLSETRFIIESNLPLLDYVKKDHISGNSSLRAMSKVYMLVPAIENLRTIPALRPTISKLTSNKVFSMTMENFNIESNIADQFMIDLSELKSQCQLIIQLANDTIPRMNQNTICIKLADDSTFDSMSETVKAFSNLFTLISANQKIDGDVKLSGIESGSMWVYAAATKATTKFLCSIFSDIYNIAKKFIELKKANALYRQLEIKTDILEKEKDVHNKMCEVLIKKIDEANNLNLPADETQQWIKCISSVATMIEKGNEVHPSLEAPQDIKTPLDSEIKGFIKATENVKLLSSTSEEPSTDNISDDTPTDDNSAEE